MSEEKKERTLDDVRKEYGGLLPRAGNLQYQIYALQKDLDILLSSMRDLNLEGAAITAKAPAPEQVTKEEG